MSVEITPNTIKIHAAEPVYQKRASMMSHSSVHPVGASIREQLPTSIIQGTALGPAEAGAGSMTTLLRFQN